MDRTTQKRIIVGIVGLLLIGCILIYLKSLYPNEQYEPWKLPVKHLEWTMKAVCVTMLIKNGTAS